MSPPATDPGYWGVCYGYAVVDLSTVPEAAEKLLGTRGEYSKIPPKFHLRELEVLHLAAKGMTAVALQNLPFGLLCSQLQAAAKCLSIKLKPVALVPSLKLSFDSFDRHCSRPLYVCSQQDQVVNQRVAQAYCHFQS